MAGPVWYYWCDSARSDAGGPRIAAGGGPRELVRDADAGERRLRAAADDCAEGADTVHQILSNAELSQLKKNSDTVVRLVAWLPPKLRSTYLVGASDAQQRFWVGVFAKMPRHSRDRAPGQATAS